MTTMMSHTQFIRLWIGTVIVLLLAIPTTAAFNFVVEDIRLQGLMRVSAGTVFNEISIQVDDEVDALAIRTLIRELFDTGYFDDIKVSRDDNVVVIEVKERPAIDSISIEGNKAIQTDDLLEGLASQGLREGEIFKQATLDRVRIELQRQYVAQGQYTAAIEANIEELPRNRVGIGIVIDEGKKSGIRQIEFVGNESYPKSELLGAMELSEPTLFGFIRGNSQYSRQKLQGDLESLQAYYRDRGHVQFQILSTDVSMTPDRKQVYLTIALSEGEKYKINQIDLLGDFGEIDPDYLAEQILIEEGEIFSSARVTATEEYLTLYYNANGYTFASISGIPTINEDGTVDLQFLVTSGRRVYVRRIDFTGNIVTQDGVLRREMLQIEGARASTNAVENSKRRLEQLGYFETVNIETPAVVGSDDQIDVKVNVSEQPTGTIGATFGYQKQGGLLIGGSFEQTNIGGTGNSLSTALNYSQYSKSLSFNYLNPYYTDEGVSLGVGVYFNDTDYSGIERFTRFSTGSFGGGLNLGFPLGIYKRMQFSGVVEWTDITHGYNEAQQISSFVDLAGSKFLNYKVEVLWSHNRLNSPIFATRGNKHLVAFKVSLPGSDLQFFQTTYQADWYFPFRNKDDWAWHFRTELGYGQAYGDSEQYPFFEHYHAGGFGSVRGYEQHTLGPRSTPSGRDAVNYPQGRPFGGNVKFETSLELVFPLPFLENIGQVRSVAFIDAGNVFSTSCVEDTIGCFEPSADHLRYSAGVGVSWLTRMGPMSFSLSIPFNDEEFDEVETFAFEIGQSF